ncbi:unnamed protein product, partial [marine sediment metagenome]
IDGLPANAAIIQLLPMAGCVDVAAEVTLKHIVLLQA